MVTLLIFLTIFQFISAQEPIVEIEDGKLLGTTSFTVSGRPYSIFKGIPFAQPPVNELRFLAPEPNFPWEGLRNATALGKACKSIYYSGFVGDEDCLYLNVRTPITDFSSPIKPEIPVMVYIHGGAYIFNSGGFANGYFLMDHDVILVSINYRLNAFGFLSLNTSEVSGNQGLRDQQLALKWVQKNIHHFGGDPNKVTIFGQSAGSWSVLHQLLSPGSSGLFTKAIAQSGAFAGGLSLRPKTAEQEARKGLALASILGCDTLECMQSLPADKILSVPFLPRGSIDTLSEDPMLPGNPDDLLKSGQFNRVPLMIGNTNAESIMVFDVLIGLLGFTPLTLEASWTWLGPLMTSEAYIDNIDQRDEELAFDAKRFYMKPFGIITEKNLDKLINLGTDCFFQYNVHWTARMIAKHVPNVFQYRFSHKGPYNAVVDFSEEIHSYGVSHADDLYYTFDYSDDECALFNASDFKMASDYTRFFANFAKTADPNNLGEEGLWKPIDQDSYGYFEFDHGYRMITEDPDYKDRMMFWQEAIEKYQNAGKVPKNVTQNSEHFKLPELFRHFAWK